MDRNALKAIRDWQWLLQSAWREGYKEGFREGFAMGLLEGRKEAMAQQIQKYQDFLGGSITPKADLLSQTLEQLGTIRTSLMGQVAAHLRSLPQRNPYLCAGENPPSDSSEKIRDAAMEQD